MGSTIGKFSFQVRNKDGSLPPETVVTLENYSDLEGVPTVSTWMTEVEIDGSIQSLKDDLDRVGREAKAALRRAKEKRQRPQLSAPRDPES